MWQQIPLMVCDILALYAVVTMIKIIFRTVQLELAEERFDWGSRRSQEEYQEQLGRIVPLLVQLTLVVFLILIISRS